MSSIHYSDTHECFESHMNVFHMMMIACHSAGVEGSQLDINDTEQLLVYDKVASNKSYEHHKMVEYHFEAIKFVFEKAKKKEPISEQLIQDIVKLVKKNTGEIRQDIYGYSYSSANGDYRRNSVSAGGRIFMDYKKVPDKMKLLVSDIAKNIDSLQKEKDIRNLAYLTHFNLVSIHPFSDGNGRTSRLLMNYIELYHQLSPTIVLRDLKKEYIAAIEDYRKTDELAPYFNFMENVRKEGLRVTQKLIDKRTVNREIIQKKGGLRMSVFL